MVATTVSPRTTRSPTFSGVRCSSPPTGAETAKTSLTLVIPSASTVTRMGPG